MQMSGLIWIQTVRQSGGILKRILENVYSEKKADEKTFKIIQHAKG